MFFKFIIGTFNCFVITNVLEILEIINLTEKHLACLFLFAVRDVQFITEIESIVVRSCVRDVTSIIHFLNSLLYLL